MILKRHTVFDILADYDPATDTFVTFSRTSDPGRASAQVTGAFDFLGDTRVLLFRLEGILYLQFSTQRMRMADHTIEVKSISGGRVLRVLSDKAVMLELIYEPAIIDPPLSQDPTPFVEEEDFDFGLFLANLSHNRARQARVYAGS
jgi:hypothetical protein